MPSHFNRPHIEISCTRNSQSYTGQGLPSGDSNALVRAEHGKRLQKQMQVAFEAIELMRQDAQDNRIPQAESTYLEVELRKGAKADSLEFKNLGIKPAAAKLDADDIRRIALLVPDDARLEFAEKLSRYTSGELTEKGKNPPLQKFAEAIQNLQSARLETLWTDDPKMIPRNADDCIWWEVWCWPDKEEEFDKAAVILEARTASKDHRLYFSEVTVIPTYAARSTIELLLFKTCHIIELRRATDNPSFFTEDAKSQHEWNSDLAERIIWPADNVPSVCILDTGVNRAHYLIEPALSAKDCYAIRDEWGVDDSGKDRGHGTLMAGMCLHGDLTFMLSDQGQYKLVHRLESVKILPPQGFDENNPGSYGKITQIAVSTSEIDNPERIRTFCLAVTSDHMSGKPSTWSAAIDQAACGEMPGDEENAPKRLFVVSAGNIPSEIDATLIKDAEHYPIENPAQAWNALTVGGYTDKIHIAEQDLEDYTPFSEAGDLSPFSRTSMLWEHNKSPIKPEIVLEAGNRAVSPSRKHVYSTDSLALLSTGKNTDKQPLEAFSATSAATAQAARMAARITAQQPELWPETVRALLVHSAEWTKPMLKAFSSSNGMRNNYALIRRYGYGVPTYERAVFSAQNHLALTAQAEIQPYRLEGSRKFNECHYYSLPWPKDVLEQLGNTEIKLKITLSYFIEPNPGLSASIDPQRYQSFGLRFDLRRKNETEQAFKKRVNAAERLKGEDKQKSVSDDGNWILGPKAISAGSLHCDVLTCPAVDLLSRDVLCVYPVGGWWRDRAIKEICNKASRYALIVTIQTKDTDIDIYTPIKTIVDTQINTDILI